MFKLFIVDDEINRIETIKTLIPWSEYQIKICGEANNGLTAFEAIKKLRPDIVISDIRMPIMDGLELFQKIKQENINIKGIILSGYDDFEYAKKAINLNVIEYLLKPCRPEEILEAVLKGRNMLEQELKNKSIIEDYRLSKEESINQKRREVLKELTIGKNKYLEEDEKKVFEYNIRKSAAKSFAAIIFNIDDKSKIIDYKKLNDVKTNIIDLGKKYFNHEILIEYFENLDDIIFIILIDKSYFNSKAILKNINEIKDSVKVSLTVGVGTLVDEIKDINQSYNSAVLGLEAKFFLGKNRVINLTDITPYKNMAGFYPVSEEQDILNCLETGNREFINQNVERFYNRLSDDKVPSKSFFQKVTINLCGRIYKFCIDKNINVKDIFDSDLKVFDLIEEFETITELKIYVCSILNNIIDKSNEIGKKSIVITKAIEYIMKNFSKDISLETVSKEIYISPGYLSMLFKQEMGINFIDYISKYRIEKAKELLKDNSLKNYQVCKMVGFNDEKYFSQLFKKYTGLTPTQYRQK